MGFVVLVVLAVLIFIGLRNKKKIAAEQQKTAEEKKIAEQKAAEEKKIAEQKAAEEKKIAEEKAAEEKKKREQEFWVTFNVVGEVDAILSVLEKSRATAENFEKGLEHFCSKTETVIAKEDILHTMKKALFVRAFDSDNCAVAKTVAADYFIQNVVKGEMLTQYMRFAIAKEKGDFSGWMPSYVKALYGIAGHAFNYQCYRSNPKNYQAMSPDAFKLIIEHSDVLKSYTDEDPFSVDEVREKWTNDMYDSPLKMVRSSKLGDVLDDEKYIDEMCYLTYTILREDKENGDENASVSEIAVTYNKFLEEIYDRINR